MDEENKSFPTGEENAREVVSWYAPQAGREVVSVYVHRDPLPEAVSRAAPPRTPPKKRRTWLWILSSAVAVLVVIAVAGSFLFPAAGPSGSGLPDKEEPSSILRIFSEDSCTIPRCATAPEVHMTLLAPDDTVLAPQDIFARVCPSTVTVACTLGGGKTSIGTGVLLTEDGYFLTNAHVINGASECIMVTDEGTIYEAQLVGCEPEEDLAVLRAVDARGLTPAEFCDSDYCVVGDGAYAIGNPMSLSLRGTFTQGMISGVQRQMVVDGNTYTMLQTTAALNNGNSGGPLINDRGQVIGINTMKLSKQVSESQASVEGLGFALPSNFVSFVVNDILAVGEFRGVPTFGFTIITRELDGQRHVVVRSVENGSPAEKVGVQVGDVLLQVDHVTLHENWDLLDYRHELHAGDTVTLTILRNGETLRLAVTLEGKK